MSHRASPSGVVLNHRDAALVKGMLLRGDRQHDIAAWFGVNAGRVAEVAAGARFAEVVAATSEALPPAGPYLCGRQISAALEAVAVAKDALAAAGHLVNVYSSRAG
jgi:hypothetical protein